MRLSSLVVGAGLGINSSFKSHSTLYSSISPTSRSKSSDRSRGVVVYGEKTQELPNAEPIFPEPLCLKRRTEILSESVKCRFSKCRFSAELHKLEKVFEMGGSIEK